MGIPLTARALADFTPPALLARNIKTTQIDNPERAAQGKPVLEPIMLKVRVPTMYERDAFSAALVRGGVVHYSRKQIRDLMLAAVEHLRDKETFEQDCADLEELWAAADAQTKCQVERTDRYMQLMERDANRPKNKPAMTEQEMEDELQSIQPESVIDDKKRVRVTAIQQDLTSRYEPLQKAFADLAEQDTRRAWLCVESYVVTWKGLEHTPDGNGRGGITRDEAEWLRAQIGADAFEETADFIYALHGIDGDEEKNLASLIENFSAPIGSPRAESMASKINGTSTDEPSTATRGKGSRKTTGTSSSSSKPSATSTDASQPSQTADA